MTVINHLLFFDTFSHETSDTIQLDLVQFPRAVQVSEVRVIPLGARVKADFPGGVRLGATNPSKFEIEFFVNDLSKRGAATFENIGSLQYSQHGNIQLEFEKKPPTDGLLLRGSYNTITLAVYGIQTKVQRDPTPPKPQARTDIVPQPPPEKVNTNERIRDWLEDTKRKQHAYELNPSEDDTLHWEVKQPSISPAEFEENKEWRDDNEESVRNYEREKAEEEEKRRKERNERIPCNKRDGSRDSRDKEKEYLRENKQMRRSGGESGMPEEEEEVNNDNESAAGVGGGIDASRGKHRNLESEWEDRRSDRSDNRSLRRPRTPLESPLPPPPPSDSPTSDAARGAVVALPPPILSDEMEAISDNEDIPDLPAEEAQGVEFAGEDQMEEEEQHHPTVIEEVVPEEPEACCEYEEIMSDEDDLPEYQYEEDYLVEEWEDWVKPFSPQDVVELPELIFISPPTEMSFQVETKLWNLCQNKIYIEEKLALGNKLSQIVSETSLPSIVLQRTVDIDLSQDVPEETGELWVQAVEQACQILPKALIYLNCQKEILETLFSWVDCGLDFNMAINQQQPVFKIRHMKAGIRLCSLLLQCSDSVTSSLLKRGMMEKLFFLSDQPYLALSIRLMIFRAIDAMLNTPSGISYFISEKTVDKKTGYERILHVLSTLQQSRAKVAAAVLVRKVHLLEICEKLQMDVLDMTCFGSSDDTNESEGVKKEEENPPGGESPEVQSNLFQEQENTKIKIETPEGEDSVTFHPSMANDGRDKLRDSPLWNYGLPSPLLQSIVSCLKEILRTYIFADQLLVQPVRWLPGSKQFQLPKHGENPYRHIYTVFEISGLLETIAVLLSTPSVSQNPSLLGYIKSFLLHLIKNEHGLRYLAWERKASLLIVRALLQFGEESRFSPSEGESLFHLGTHISTMLHVVHQLDCIASLGNVVRRRQKPNGPSDPNGFSTQECLELDYSQAVVHFNALESLLMTANGKEAVVSVLGRPRFTEILFPYLYLDSEEDNPDISPTKFACLGYAVDLIILTVKYQNDAKFLEAYAEKLHNIILSSDRVNPKLDEWTKICDILPWLVLAKNPDVFTYDKLQSLVNIVQENLDKLEKFPGELITALRILCYLTIPENPVGEFSSDDHNNELIEELKYKYATMQLFSSDLHTHLVNLLSKLFGMYQQPFLHSSDFVGSEGGYIVMLVKPSLALLDNIVTHIIQARNTDFKDLTAVVPLVQVYILMQAFSSSSPHHMVAQKLKQNVINILLGFTRVIYTTEGEEILSKSLWTQMMAEIFKYLMSAPHVMVSVITLVTELLPLPLPIQTQVPLTQEETLHAIRLRKLWSAHLYSLAPTIQELIHRLGLATHPLLTHSLRRMCVSLSDLSAPMALLVAKATLDLLLQTHRLDQRTWSKEESRVVTVKEELNKAMGPCCASQQTTRALNMLASLVSHAPTKAAVLHLLRGGAPSLTSNASKADEKYSSLVSTWCGILSLPSKMEDQSQAHIGAKECLVMIFHYLLDYENAMQVNQDEVEQEENKNMSEFILTGVPHKDILLPFVEALVDVVRASHNQVNIVRHSFRVISRLLEHNYGFFYVKSVLEKKKGCLFTTLRNLSTNFTKENPECLALLKDILYLCQLLIYPDEGRTQVISAAELSLYLGWKNEVPECNISKSGTMQDKKEPEGTLKIKKEEDEKDIIQEEKRDEDSSSERTHPLKVLEHLVVSEGNDEEEAEHLYDEISQLVSLLEKESSYVLLDTCDLEEPPAVGLESLQVLFASRIVWTFPTVEDDLHSLWFSLPSYEDLDEKDSVSVNLLETCRKYADDFDLLGALHKLLNGQTSHSISPQKVPKAAPKYKPSATAIRPDRRGRPYVAPMRGRSFGRGINIRSDPFRSRPPNTSRPPSLHVDDFVALESTGHQPTGPTGYNKISFGRGKMMLDSMRVRGRVRGDSRGRFFHRPPFRGDGGRGRGIGMRRGLGWVFRGEGSPRGNFRGAPMNTLPRFLRGRPFVRGVPGIPVGPKERFPQKFIDRGLGRRDVTGGRHLRGFR